MRAVKSVLIVLFAASIASAQGRGGIPQDPIAGEWRGTLKSAQGTESPFVISVAKKGDQYGGATSGMTEANEIPLKKIVVDGTKVSIEASAESKLGQVVLAGDLTLAGNKLSGPLTLGVGLQKFEMTVDLTRRGRATVLQRHVEQKIDYFVGRWKFDYTGGEFPPLSRGNRSGTVAFSRSGASNFAMGQIDGDAGGAAYHESQMLGVDPETNTVVSVERRGDGAIFVGLGSWKSPLAIVFQTPPLVADGKSFQLRRVMSITSDDAFDITEEFSVDSGAFRRLGNGHYMRLP
jgi:hypothetical protein